MKVSKETITVVRLEMTKQEAYWLRVMLQNPPHAGESADDAIMRAKFFNALPQDWSFPE